MDKKKSIPVVIALVILFLGGIGFWYWSQKKAGAPEPEQETPKQKSSVGTAKTISESVPKIQTNPGEKVPEINPLDRANPFKYTNPLR